MTRESVFAAVAAALLAGSEPATAQLLITARPTHNVVCSGGICAPTAGRKAQLNVKDLEALLATGDVTVTTRSTRRDLDTLIVARGFVWDSPTTLTLTSGDTTIVNVRITVGNAAGGLVLNRTPFYAPAGQVLFGTGSGTLIIANVSYTLVDSLPGLASAIAANPKGVFALAEPYDASGDGIYATSPVPTNFLGILQGLGNTISNISVNNTGACCVGGLFQSVSANSTVYGVRLGNVAVNSVQGAAGLAYESFGNIENSSVTGSVIGNGDLGALVSENYGNVWYDYSEATVSAGATVSGVRVGGLVAADAGYIAQSFAAGTVSAGNGSGSVGGLLGEELSKYGATSLPQNNYATGNVSGGSGLNIGGLVGTCDYNPSETTLAYGYSLGVASGGSGSTVGGLIGTNDCYLSNDYWDTDTSGTFVGIGVGNAAGVTGLTTAQFQSGLAALFYPIWAQSTGVNNDFPYLVNNPPPQ